MQNSKGNMQLKMKNENEKYELKNQI